MSEDLTCSQVLVLLSYYINGKTNSQISKFIEQHLQKCSLCSQRYVALKNLIEELNKSKIELEFIEPQKSVPISAYSNNFRQKMSEYVDNELNDEESLKFKKYAISNPPVRDELEGMYKVKNALKSSFEKTKQDFKDDLAKDIIVKLDLEEFIYEKESIMLKVAAIFIFIFVFLSLSVIIALA